MPLTAEQEAIVAADIPQGEVLRINAYAGTGKTFTLTRFARQHRKKTLYLAFNKAMADEAQEKFSDERHVTAKTLHALAFKSHGLPFKDRLGDIKPVRIMSLACQVPGQNDTITASKLCEWLHGFMSSAAGDPGNYFDAHLVDHEASLEENGIAPGAFRAALIALWDKVLNDPAMPFPHNAYLKLFQLAGEDLGYEYVLVDEAQDVTDCMISLVLQQKSARKIFIGDTYQQIYSWNGAVNSLAKIGNHARTLYLTRSFRCPERVARIANQYLRLLGAPKDFHGSTQPHPNKDRAVIARTNTMLFSHAADCVETERLHYLGGFDSYGFEVLVDMAYLWMGQKAKVRDPFIQGFACFADMVQYVENTSDGQLAARIKIVSRFKSRTPIIYYKLREEQVPREQATLILCTGHKAKGQEFGHVTLCPDFLSLVEALEALRACNGTTDLPPIAIDKEELRLLYVAITRSMDQLEGVGRYLVTPAMANELRLHIHRGNLVLTD